MWRDAVYCSISAMLNVAYGTALRAAKAEAEPSAT